MEITTGKEDEVAQTGVYDLLDDIHSHVKELDDRLNQILIPDQTTAAKSDSTESSCSPMMQKTQLIHDTVVSMLQRIQL